MQLLPGSDKQPNQTGRCTQTARQAADIGEGCSYRLRGDLAQGSGGGAGHGTRGWRVQEGNKTVTSIFWKMKVKDILFKVCHVAGGAERCAKGDHSCH